MKEQKYVDFVYTDLIRSVGDPVPQTESEHLQTIRNMWAPVRVWSLQKLLILSSIITFSGLVFLYPVNTVGGGSLKFCL